MAHSLKIFRQNLAKYYDVFYQYMIKFMYYGSVPTIILLGNTLHLICRSFNQATPTNGGMGLSYWQGVLA